MDNITKETIVEDIQECIEEDMYGWWSEFVKDCYFTYIHENAEDVKMFFSAMKESFNNAIDEQCKKYLWLEGYEKN